MDILLIASVFISFILSVVILPKWILKCQQVGFLWEDMNKANRGRASRGRNVEDVAASGGIIVVMAFVLGVLAYIAIRTFIFNENGTSLEIFALLSVILILAIVGFVDDVLGWTYKGLSVRFRLFLAFAASIPLVVINAGVSEIGISHVGSVDIGILYALVIIPIGIAGATTTYNFLAGFNGLEAGQGIIIISFLSFIAYATGNPWLTLIGLCMVASLLVFYFYNKYPAKVFPGDVLTYSIGALIAGMAILGNFEKIAVFVFIPYIMETVLKVRGRLKKQSFGKVRKDGSLDIPYDKVYGLTHLSIFILKKFNGKVYEKSVVYLIFAFQIFICLLTLLIFKKGLFL